MNLPDENKRHILKVVDVVNTQKTFSTKEGVKQKILVTFEGGYVAEYCPLLGEDTGHFVIGKFAAFDIGYRGTRGDEINPRPLPDSFGKQEGLSSPSPVSLKLPVNMHGHPAYLALGISEKFVSQFPNMDRGEKWLTFMAYAEELCDWMKQKQQE